MDADQAKALREPFPPEHIGHVPKGGVQLAFVGHAHVTDRLLEVDPDWNWWPMGKDDRGLPVLDDSGNLWIVLTVCGVSTIGCGDGISMKEKIGDAIRNAAMRRGVALDLWAKETPVWDQGDQRPVSRSKPKKPEVDAWSSPPVNASQGPEGPPSPAPERSPLQDIPHLGGKASAAQIKLVHVLMRDHGIIAREEVLEKCSELVGRNIDSSSQLTKLDASTTIDGLNAEGVA